MKYMLLIYSAEEDWTTMNREKFLREFSSKAGTDKNLLLDFSLLSPVTAATCVRVRNGERHVTKGPFAETPEPLVGYLLIDVPGLEEAVAIACQWAPDLKSTVEIRPLLPLSDSLALPGPIGTGGTAIPVGLGNPFLLLMYAEEGAWPPEDHRRALAESVEICHHLHQQGQYLSASPLHPPSMATCVQLRGGSHVVRDGPFPETKEQLGGYFLINVPNLNAAVEIAATIPGSHRGTAEIRPLLP